MNGGSLMFIAPSFHSTIHGAAAVVSRSQRGDLEDHQSRLAIRSQGFAANRLRCGERAGPAGQLAGTKGNPKATVLEKVQIDETDVDVLAAGLLLAGFFLACLEGTPPHGIS